MEEGREEIGLKTEESLNRLHLDIDHVLNQYKSSQKNRKSKSWIKDTLHYNSPHTIVNWMSVAFILFLVVLLAVSCAMSGDTFLFIYEITIIIVLLIFNVGFQLYDSRLRHNEMPNRIKQLLDLIAKIKDSKWLPENYPHLCSPISPCITLQWTYRDNKIINLPWGLLVKDDVVLIRPGQISPGYCESVDKNVEYPLLHAKEVYGPSLQNANEIFSIPKSRKPLETRKYKLLETPFLNNLRIALEQAQDRPVSQHNKQRNLIMIKLVERIVVPTFIAVVIAVNFIRLLYLESYVGKASAVDLFILIPVATILPLVPLILPTAWTLLSYFGLARIKFILKETIESKSWVKNVLEEQDNASTDHIKINYQWRDVCRNFINIVQGNGDIMARTANLLHVLGSLTAFCCIDKKGILSWPNPSAEKVFFLHNADNLSDSSSLANFGDLHGDGDSVKGGNPDIHHYHDEGSNGAVAEVLDLTHNQSDPFKLHFDDTKWNKHLSSLKPLGLSILLNTCNVETQEHYTKFCSHITCEAMYNENLVPVTNRRCLCELAKEIGFVEQAQKIFTLDQQLSTFRHLQPEMVRRDNKYAKSLSMSTKLKFPFPHMFAVVVKEISTGSMQLLSQGTADIILDSCVDYWDGHDLCPLAPSDRKKVQDFYQRSSLTAYCTAFAYRPLSKGVSDKLTQVYLELPSDSRHLYHNHRSPTPLLWDCSRSVLEPKIKAPLGPFFSTDSLLYNDSPCSDVTDAESCFDMQCNQVFIGMVTMQYQAQSDMVHLIEQLERACIRFVHFSKENELRSRVFSEKMGLESGWNCHISLLSDRNSGLASNTGPGYMPHRRISQSARKLHSSGSPPFDNKFSNLESSRTMSFSAPSAINMEHSVVKFNTENHPLIKYSVDESETDQNISTQKINSSDSVQMQTEICNVQHDWQSLSGLTDSTEQSAPINFDMSNRAKLPRGIENIRPHIEQIDNVPLLVSLFTDCTAAGTREMLHIMQEYGEVVCVMGSSASNENMGIFMQADASIAVEPLYPQVCQNLEPFINFNEKITPTELSRFLNSIACSISLRREEPVSFYYLVFEARHYISSIWNSVQFWLCCLVTMSFMQTVAALFMLPALLSPGQVLWIICLIVPLLSISLMGTPIDHDIMKKPQSKNQIEFNTEVAGFVLWCYGIKFVPLIVVIITTFAGTLSGHCRDICDMQNCTCVLFYLPKFEESSNITKNWTDVEHSYTLLTAQHFTVIVILLHFVAISAGFVHRQHLFWSRSPHTNRFWLLAVIILLFVQPIYTVLGLVYSSKENSGYDEFHVVHAFQIFAFCSPILTILVNETVKKQEIKVQLYQLMILQERDLYYLTYSISYFYQVRYRKNFNVYFPNNFNSGLSWFFKVNLRYQRRARLDFGTKLGMNSPF